MRSSKPIVTSSGFLISFCVVILISLTRASTAQAPNYVGDDCHNKTPQALTDSYKANLNQLLSWLSTDAATSKGYNHTSFGTSTNAVYGLYDCRGDDAGYFCQFCVSTATREVLQRCPNQLSAVIWYDFCIFRYSNKNFFGKVTTSPWWSAGRAQASDPAEGKKAESFMRSLIGKAMENTTELGARGEFDLGGGRERYALVQCSRDLNSEGCKQCLETMVDRISQCCEQKQGWQVLAPSCMIKYDNYMFYQSTSSLNNAPNHTTTAKKGITKSKALIISISVLVAVVIISFSVYFWRKKNRKDEMPLERTPVFDDISQKESSLNTDLPTIPLFVIQQSTHNFSEKAKLGQGGFGPVYKGTMPDGEEIAVKRLSQTSGQGLEEFKNEVIFIAKLQHRNLVRLLGCCIEENEKLLVYEYMQNSSLDCHLFNFGLARTFDGAQNQEATRRVMGTYGYMAPEYAMGGLFSVKSDVFSFGVLLLEIICGKRISGFYLSDHGQSLLIYTWNLWREGKCLELMDPMLEDSNVDKGGVLKCIHIGLLCVQEDASDRPTMSTVVVMLASDTMTFPKPNRPAFSVGKMFLGDSSSTSKNSKDPSVNEVTMSLITPR
ncbi:hypothetical protein QN277_010801 [Acacia crassicarpa]|uniref:non-specific serine/threonine protein kinase n=1 Tax=Acacia crassicarpa TaxID=499986 RepID=A0AAE1M8D2_9FABA|nr:hypothetical protein QN277_010801 [Acacia crassicarpa]